jgi:hypothetical protein
MRSLRLPTLALATLVALGGTFTATQLTAQAASHSPSSPAADEQSARALHAVQPGLQRSGSFVRFASFVEMTSVISYLQSRQASSGPPLRPVQGHVSITGDPYAALRQCESGGNYAIDTGNGFYGAYQFLPSTWRALGFPGLPSEAPPAMQDAAARKLQAISGWGQWPACSARLGLR